MIKLFALLILVTVLLQPSCAKTETEIVTLNDFKKEAKDYSCMNGEIEVTGKNDLGYSQRGWISSFGTEQNPHIVLSGSEQYWTTHITSRREGDNVVDKALLIEYYTDNQQDVLLVLTNYNGYKSVGKTVAFAQGAGIRKVPFTEIGKKRDLSHVESVMISGSMKIVKISLIQPVTLTSLNDKLTRMQVQIAQLNAAIANRL